MTGFDQFPDHCSSLWRFADFTSYDALLNTTSRDDDLYGTECAYNFVDQSIYVSQDPLNRRTEPCLVPYHRPGKTWNSRIPQHYAGNCECLLRSNCVAVRALGYVPS